MPETPKRRLSDRHSPRLAGTLQEQKEVSPEVARGVYSQREAFLAKREAEGELSFRYVENDGTPDNNTW